MLLPWICLLLWLFLRSQEDLANRLEQQRREDLERARADRDSALAEAIRREDAAIKLAANIRAEEAKERREREDREIERQKRFLLEGRRTK